jgi:hypothetical protein
MTNLPFLIFLASAAVIAAVFIWTARSTAEPSDVDYTRTRRLTLPRLPYPIEAAAPEQIVNVVGKQYAFSLTSGPGPASLDVWDRDFSPDIEVRAGMNSASRRSTSITGSASTRPMAACWRRHRRCPDT